MSNHLSLCHPLLLLSSIFPSIRVSSNVLVLRISVQSIGASASVLQLINMCVNLLGLSHHNTIHCVA